jgi:acyl carrier protein
MEQKFLDLFKETLEIENREIYSSDLFRDFEEWDSLALLSVIAMIDEEYNLIIESKVFQKLNSLNDVINYIKTNKQLD